MRQAWISQRVVTPGGEYPAAVIVEDGVIAGVCRIAELPLDAGLSMEVHDAGDLAILPGLVDTHVHLNEPGRTHWEGFASGTRAAAAGGYTTVIDMPLNCLPETTSVAALEKKREAARGQCRVDWMSWGGAVDGNVDDLRPLAAAGVPGYKCFLVYPGCEGFTSIDSQHLEQCLPTIASTGLPLLVHAELQAPIDAATALLPAPDSAAWRSYSTYLASRPDEAEVAAIRMLLQLCRRYRFRLHIVHLATGEAVELLREAKAEGLPVTVETCPHYLHLCAEGIADGATEFKCAPPIRGESHREALWQALRNGVIDAVVTDHSPCPPEMKRREDGRFNIAWGGIASLSTALPVMWTEAQRRGHSLRELVRWMSGAPAALAGLRHRVGGIEAGRDANFLLFDPEAEFTVTEAVLHYRHKVSPYLGERLRGVVRRTVLRGRTVFHDGTFPGENIGRECTLAAH